MGDPHATSMRAMLTVCALLYLSQISPLCSCFSKVYIKYIFTKVVHFCCSGVSGMFKIIQ